jgi:NTE family protein
MKDPVAVVTTFGLARTPAQVGMMEELAERGIVADFVVGTSLGAINSAALATQRVDGLRDFWGWIHEEVLSSPLRAIAKSMTGVQARKQEAALRRQLTSLLPTEFPQDLRLAATDLETGGERILSGGDLIDAVMASTALPGVFPPMAMDEDHLIDGGLVAGMPLNAVPAQAQTVVVLDTGHSAVSPEIAAGYRWWEVGALAYAHLIRGQAVNALVHAARTRPVVMVSTDTGRLLDFTDPVAMMDAGRDVAAQQLDALPNQLQPGIYGLPSGLDEFEVLQSLRKV